MDKPFSVSTSMYRSVIEPVLPPSLLDFHTHAWMADQWLDRRIQADIPVAYSGDLGFPASRYMTTELSYPVEQLLADGQMSFPGKSYEAVCFGQPTPSADTGHTNRYIAESARSNLWMHPLMVAGGGHIDAKMVRAQILNHGFVGIKVFLNWIGNDYGSHTVESMLTDEEMSIANLMSLVIMLHVPRADRLADPAVQHGVIRLAKACPSARIVLAHCGRCYHPLEMSRAIRSVRDLENVLFDTSMVMEPLVIERVMREAGSGRILFATDFPVAAMVGKRVNVLDHWVDLVGLGYPPGDYRIEAAGLRAMTMAQEIALAVIMAADAAGLTQSELHGIFYGNGIKILQQVRHGLSQMRPKHILDDSEDSEGANGPCTDKVY